MSLDEARDRVAQKNKELLAKRFVEKLLQELTEPHKLRYSFDDNGRIDSKQVFSGYCEERAGVDGEVTVEIDGALNLTRLVKLLLTVDSE